MDYNEIPLENVFVKMENIDNSDYDGNSWTFCQACLANSNGDNMKNMMTPYSYEGKSEIYSDMFNYCFSMQMMENVKERLEDVYLICESCIKRLREVASFRKQVEDSQKNIKRRLVKKVTPITLDLSKYNLSAENSDGQSGDEDNDFVSYLVGKLSAPQKSLAVKKQKKSASKVAKKQTDRKKILPRGPVHRSNSLKVVRKQSQSATVDQRLPNDGPDHANDVSMKANDSESSTKPLAKKSPFVKTMGCNDLPYVLDKYQLNCKICGETFETHKSLQIHMPGHFPNYTCEHCGRGFANNVQFKIHRNVHSTERFECSQCPGKFFKTADSRLAHTKRKHSDNPNIHKCPYCHDRFASYDIRRKHLITVHGKIEEVRKYKCKLCEKTFTTSGHRATHVRKIHLNERNHTCKTCGKSFFANPALIQHMLKHTGARNFPCNVCGKSFQRKYTLTEHMKIHTGEKRHVCNVCGKAFTQKCSLKGHMTVHEREGLKGES